MTIKISSRQLEDYLGLAFLINLTIAVVNTNVVAMGFLWQALRLKAPEFTGWMWIAVAFIICHLSLALTIYLIAKAVEYAQKD